MVKICLSMQGQMFNPWEVVKIPHAKRQLSLKATIREAHAIQGRAHTLQRRSSAAKKKKLGGREEVRIIPTCQSLVFVFFCPVCMGGNFKEWVELSAK